MNRTVEQRAMRKVYWRILPFTGLLYLICYIDRVNVGFAALTMRQDLGLSQAAFGLGAGTAFFLGYFLLEVPSNVILHKIGARLWIARIVITWGLISGATAFVVGEWSFYRKRNFEWHSSPAKRIQVAAPLAKRRQCCRRVRARAKIHSWPALMPASSLAGGTC